MHQQTNQSMIWTENLEELKRVHHPIPRNSSRKRCSASFCPLVFSSSFSRSAFSSINYWKREKYEWVSEWQDRWAHHTGVSGTRNGQTGYQLAPQVTHQTTMKRREPEEKTHTAWTLITASILFAWSESEAVKFLQWKMKRRVREEGRECRIDRQRGANSYTIKVLIHHRAYKSSNQSETNSSLFYLQEFEKNHSSFLSFKSYYKKNWS